MQINSTNGGHCVAPYASSLPLPRAPRYQALNTSQHQIRILHILPGQYSDTLRCELHTESLHDRPIFEALSYSWGDQHILHPIEVDGQQADIATHLYNVLRRLRFADKTRRIWADALCINQANTIERSHQVSLMRDIYSFTNEAILWLGDFSDSNFTAYAKASDCIPEVTAITAFALLRSMAAGCHWSDVIDDKQFMPRKYLGALSALMKLSWWQRAWTVQEAIIPSKATFYCGTIQLPLWKVMLAHSASLEHDWKGCCAPDPRYYDDLYKFWDCIESFRLLKEETDKAVLVRTAMEKFRFRLASDKRDCVYAYLGLGSKARADYTISHEAAFKFIVRSLIQESKNVGPLMRIKELDRSCTLPSWCPDYGTKSCRDAYGNIHFEYGWLHMYNWYCAAGISEAKTRFSPVDSRLELQGFVIDEIVEGPTSTRNTPDECQHQDPRTCQLGEYEEVGWCTMLRDICVIFSNKPRDYAQHRTREGFEIMIDEVWDARAQSQLALFQYGTFTTRTGLVGHTRVDFRAGDVICVLLGGNMPFILRPGNEVGTYEYVGQAYVHGFMDGEALQQGRKSKWITLV